MRVVVYVEGPSDAGALQTLLAPLIEAKLQDGIAIDFFRAPRGDRKTWVLCQAPRRAVNILRGNPNAVVVVLADLYPPNKGFDHRTADELREGTRRVFQDELRKKEIDDARIEDRFHVFCFKYDLEVLLLAAEEVLEEHLGTASLRANWTRPVEDQDHDKPPKQVVSELFKAHGATHHETTDAPLLLNRASYETIAARCDQCFKPFVEFLAAL